MSKMWPRIGFLLLIAAGILMPVAGLYPVFLMKLLCFALFASAFNLVLGYAGLLSLGHAAFFGIAGYVAGHTAKMWGWQPEAAVLGAMGVSAVLGWFFGSIAIRRKGIYFAMVTLALAQMLYFLCVQSPGITGAEDGLQSIPRGRLFGIIDIRNDLTIYYVVFAVYLIGLAVIHRIIHSPFGQVLQAIRENEPRVRSLGYDVERFKLLAMVLSAALSGLAGATKAVVLGIATLVDVQWHMSGHVVLMALIGGMHTLFGPSIGAVVVVGIESLLSDKVGSWVTTIMGALFVICVLAFRRGIIGEIASWIDVRWNRKHSET
jgi:branched-chain amino acid transport system permease protein